MWEACCRLIASGLIVGVPMLMLAAALLWVLWGDDEEEGEILIPSTFRDHFRKGRVDLGRPSEGDWTHGGTIEAKAGE
jgi:hypothetical protein